MRHTHTVRQKDKGMRFFWDVASYVCAQSLTHLDSFSPTASCCSCFLCFSSAGYPADACLGPDFSNISLLWQSAHLVQRAAPEYLALHSHTHWSPPFAQSLVSLCFPLLPLFFFAGLPQFDQNFTQRNMLWMKKIPQGSILTLG